MKVIPWHKLSPNTLYSFTLNLQNDGEGPMSSRVMHYIHILKKYFQHCNFELKPELSKKNRWHYHGYIWWNNYVDIQLFRTNDYQYCLNGDADIKIDTIKDYGWYDYIVKDRHLMKPYLNFTKTPYCLRSTDIKKLKSYPKTPKEQFKNELDFGIYD